MFLILINCDDKSFDTLSVYMKQLMFFEFDFVHCYACIRSLEHIVLVHYRETQEVCFLYLGNFFNISLMKKQIPLSILSVLACLSFLLSSFRLPVKITIIHICTSIILGCIQLSPLVLLFIFRRMPSFLAI